ncbi:MAG: hypothetical protein A2068_01435 [Ignavibacteria bacterium GWB2_35_6b]|nr:MAG: hypothetical protein A2068_01435 [Ignavibacteria bacterium GWB2_35_6b]
MKKSYLLLIVAALCFSILLPRELFSQAKDTNIKYAGARSSNYGIKPFPSKEEWKSALYSMHEKFEGSIPTAIWIVGVMRGSENMYLEFPSDGKEVKNVIFAEEDKHEPYLKYFDENGIKVFLQVESANADMLEVIDLVLNRYKHHPCVIGFGVDVEWYRVKDNPETGMKISDEVAEQWEKKVKEHNPDYKIFLKHWDYLWMPPKYRGDIVFVDDSQMLESFDAMVAEFKNTWAANFFPNTVIFQIGYKADKPWWQNFQDPPKYMGEKIAEAIKGHECGIIWVDFTLKDVVPVK